MTTTLPPNSTRSVITSLRQELETLCFQEKGSGREIIGEPHRISDWAMTQLNSGTLIEGLSADQRTATGHRPLCFAVRRYRNYVTGFVEQHNGTLEFLPDRIYLHATPPAHLYAAAPLWRPENSLCHVNVFRTPESVQKVYLKRQSIEDFRTLWCVSKQVDTDPFYLSRSNLPVSYGQFIREVDKLVGVAVDRIYPDQKNEHKRHLGGWWWNAVMDLLHVKSKDILVNKLLKFRDGYEAFDPIDTATAGLYQSAIDLMDTGNTEKDLLNFVKRSKTLLVACLPLASAKDLSLEIETINTDRKTT